MEQLILHLIGDYLTQSDWMAQNKTKAHLPAFVHALVYSAPFLLLTRSPLAMAVIFCTHFLIDRFRLARYVVWAKNWLGPKKFWYASGMMDWTDNELEIHPNVQYRIEQPTPYFGACSATGYPPNRPMWLSVWLLIIADNTLHLAINYAALRWM